jgi:uncharacterized membrane protein
MKRSTFDALVGFLQGVFWAFLLIGAWITFHLAGSLFGISLAIFAATIYVFVSLLALLFLETVRTYRLKADETAKQTKLLEEIRDLLKSERTE